LCDVVQNKHLEQVTAPDSSLSDYLGVHVVHIDSLCRGLQCWPFVSM